MSSRRPGFALITVMWLVAMIALVTAIAASRLRTDIARTGDAVSIAQARAAADGAAHEAAFRLIGKAAAHTLESGISDIAAFAVEIGGALVEASVADEDGKIDVNGAPPVVLAALFRYAGVPGIEAGSLADRVADFRDADDLSRPNGAEGPDYAAAGLDAGPKDAAFDDISELHQVMGMTPEIVGRVAPLLTVHSGRSQFDPRVAPVPDLFQRLDGGTIGINVAASRLRIFSVRAVARMPDGTRFVRYAVLRLTGDPRHPAAWIHWSSG